LLNPTTKTSLFDSKSFTEEAVNWKQQYIDATRERFEQNYATMDLSNNIANGRSISSTIPAKHRWDDDDDDEFRRRIVDKRGSRMENEFDRYIQLPLAHDTRDLKWWRKNHHDFSHLARMVRDVYAVPASGVGVEREFSKSGRVASWTRLRLNPDTITESIMYKSYLARQGTPIEEWNDDVETPEGDTEEKGHIQRLTRDFARGYNLVE